MRSVHVSIYICVTSTCKQYCHSPAPNIFCPRLEHMLEFDTSGTQKIKYAID